MLCPQNGPNASFCGYLFYENGDLSKKGFAEGTQWSCRDKVTGFVGIDIIVFVQNKP